MKELKFHGDSIITGRGSIEYLKNVDTKRAFIVTGGCSMFKNGTIDRMREILGGIGCEVYVHSGIRQNPTPEEVLKGVEAMRSFKPDLVVGLGGGSAIDAAKVMSVFYDCPELTFDSANKGMLPNKRYNVRLIAIPTTSGTASEVTKAAVITYKDIDLKMSMKSDALIPDIAILDADLTMSMPDNLVAETGMDAITHAVECYISKSVDDFAECFATAAVEGLFKYLPLSYKKKDVESREKVHNYQCVAGCAFANVGVGGAHGISHGIGGRYDMAHGLINAVALPYILQYNSRDKVVKEKLDYLAKRIERKDFIQAVKDLNSELNIPRTFKEMGIPEETFEKDFDLLVVNCMKNSTLKNPVPVSKDDMVMLLRCMYKGWDVEY